MHVCARKIKKKKKKAVPARQLEPATLSNKHRKSGLRLGAHAARVPEAQQGQQGRKVHVPGVALLLLLLRDPMAAAFSSRASKRRLSGLMRLMRIKASKWPLPGLICCVAPRGELAAIPALLIPARGCKNKAREKNMSLALEKIGRTGGKSARSLTAMIEQHMMLPAITGDATAPAGKEGVPSARG